MNQRAKLVYCELCNQHVQFFKDKEDPKFRCRCTETDLSNGIVPVIWRHLTPELAEQLISNAKMLPTRTPEEVNWDLQAFNWLAGHYKIPENCAWLQGNVESIARACRYFDLALAIADVTGIYPYWPYGARQPIDRDDAVDAQLMNCLN